MAHKPHPNPNHRSRRHIAVCHRHPDTRTTTGLCATCLRDRLSLLTPSTSSSSSSDPPPELRRCKTFSSNNNCSFARAPYEPRRRSCDVYNGSKSLSSLFDLDDDYDDDNGGRQVSSSLIASKNHSHINKVENGDNKSCSTIKEGVGVNETKLLITEKELNEWRLNSGKDDNSSESFETASKDLTSVSSSSNGNSFKERPQWRKLLGIWGFLHRKKGEQCCNEEKVNTARNGNNEIRVDPDRKFVRSLSKPESNALVRNRSSKFSPNHFDNGLLRFYLTPLRSRRRSKLAKSRLKNPPSLARSMLR